MAFSRTFILLQQEAYLAQGSLSTGLTSIRNAQFPDTAGFYSGFFNLSIAFERILKLVLVVDHLRNHNFIAPSKTDLRRHGHDIQELYATSVPIAHSVGLRSFRLPEMDSIEHHMLDFFSTFAKVSRYYNLDALVTLPTSYSQPLAVWEEILQSILRTDVPPRRVATRLTKAQAIHDLFAESMFACQHGMDGKLLSLPEVFSIPAIHELAVPYSMVRIFRLLTPLLQLTGEIARQADALNRRQSRHLSHIPMLHEFFAHFRAPEVQIRNKKRWP